MITPELLSFVISINPYRNQLLNALKDQHRIYNPKELLTKVIEYHHFGALAYSKNFLDGHTAYRWGVPIGALTALDHTLHYLNSRIAK